MRTLVIRLIVAVLAALSFAGSAKAVTYDWVNLTFNPNIPSVAGSIVFDDEYWLSNTTFSFASSGRIYDPAPPGLESFSFAVGGVGGGSSDSSFVSLRRFLCSDSLIDCHPDQFGQFVVYGSYNVQLTLGSVLTGSITANDTNSNVGMATSGNPVWTIQTYRTDGPGPGACVTADVCGGGTGLWVLDRNTVPIATPVPEPETYAMWLLGMVGVLLASRNQLNKPVLGAAA